MSKTGKKDKKIVIQDEFPEDHITREAGERLRSMIVAAFEKGLRSEIDFQGVTIASTSFMDEGFAKLASHDWDQGTFREFILLKNIHPLDAELIGNVCEFRGVRFPLGSEEE